MAQAQDSFPFQFDFLEPYTALPPIDGNQKPVAPPPVTNPVPRAFALPFLIDRRDMPIPINFDFKKRVFAGF